MSNALLRKGVVLIFLVLLVFGLSACGGTSLSDGTFRNPNGWEFQFSGNNFTQTLHPQADARTTGVSRGTFVVDGNELVTTTTAILLSTGEWLDSDPPTIGRLPISNITADSFQSGVLVFTRVD